MKSLFTFQETSPTSNHNVFRISFIVFVRPFHLILGEIPKVFEKSKMRENVHDMSQDLSYNIAEYYSNKQSIFKRLEAHSFVTYVSTTR